MGIYNINVRNVNDALPLGLRMLANNNGVDEESRNGPVRVLPNPVITSYDRPMERVLFSPLRDANPFFHVMEALWMLSGRNDVSFPTQFNSKFDQFSDDGSTFYGAYGYRWRKWFGYDQLEAICEELTINPLSRRAVLAMWDAGGQRDNSVLVGMCDLYQAGNGGKDVPCNTHIYFRNNQGYLDMTVMCRSNDIVWGAYGANAVHFAFLLEYMAARLGLQVGKLFQFSNNFHYYVDVVGDYQKVMAMAADAEEHNYYRTKLLRPMPLVVDFAVFDQEVDAFIECDEVDYTEPFIRDVAEPMRQAWSLHKVKDYAGALTYAHSIKAEDWRVACTEWLERRALKHRGEK